MRSEDCREKQEQLERMRRRYRENVRFIQETARKLAVVGRLMETCRRRLAVTSDRQALSFWLEDGEHGDLSQRELDRLQDLVGETHCLGFEIQCLENELTEAD